MIKVNLLPKKPVRAAFRYDIYLFFLIVVLNFLIIASFYFFNHREASNYEAKIGAAKKEIASLNPIYQQYLSMEREKKEIQRKIQAIDGLKEGRALAARTLYDLSSQVKESLWLTSFKKTDNRFEMEGRSVENEAISSLMESLSKVPYMRAIELKSVQETTEQGIVLKKFVIQGNISL
ncbi:PilN domain-containing protein [Syntrophorhabdus aromaticivorans]|uniref:PilN domain-containing protein n=1 Tax=Syntrophorhabdus aromaticivorans TaxID=328301 RepID=UPI00040CBC1F|nr:PilN domain-containing protein [Syntrophorhabdus aromaticivorans]